jgi:peptidoglycan/xylan/chitin deacetylase (PgdA/CDA1 family)
MSGVVYLMYHELELPGRATCEAEPGYARYVVAAAAFREQMARLRADGFRGLSVGEALAETGAEGKRVVLTFDDGCETDLLVAAPELSAAGFNATSYVTVEHLGRRGYLGKGQLRNLADLNFEIGSHAMRHRLLSDLPAEEIRVELAESKDQLEQLTGRRVDHFSCPGGRWDARVARLARDVGYQSVATSGIGINSPGRDSFRLARVAVMRGVRLEEFARVARGEGLGRRRAQSAALGVAKRVLGNSIYQRLRSTLLGQGSNGAAH